MNFSMYQISFTKRVSRLILLLFVLSVINLSAQVPAHAAMQMSVQIIQTMDMDMDMDHEAMMDCHCPPVLCDSVLAVDNQSTVGLLATDVETDRVFVQIIETLDQNRGQLNRFQHYTHLQLSAEQVAQAPLQRKTLLLI